MRQVPRSLGTLILALAGCGYGSVNPILDDHDTVFEPRLIGDWTDSNGAEGAVVTAEGRNGYSVRYRETGGKGGQFHGRLGNLGGVRVMELTPAELPDSLSDVYKTLFLPLYAVVIIDARADTIRLRLLEPDSIRKALARNPGQTAHLAVSDGVVLTGSTTQVQRFVVAMMRRPGGLGEPTLWRRR